MWLRQTIISASIGAWVGAWAARRVRKGGSPLKVVGALGLRLLLVLGVLGAAVVGLIVLTTHQASHL